MARFDNPCDGDSTVEWAGLPRTRGSVLLATTVSGFEVRVELVGFAAPASYSRYKVGLWLDEEGHEWTDRDFAQWRIAQFPDTPAGVVEARLRAAMGAQAGRCRGGNRVLHAFESATGVSGVTVGAAVAVRHEPTVEFSCNTGAGSFVVAVSRAGGRVVVQARGLTGHPRATAVIQWAKDHAAEVMAWRGDAQRTQQVGRQVTRLLGEYHEITGEWL